jgi:glyoxylase-like metal-dependent hydrolase (beta-lactamase superfamily II)
MTKRLSLLVALLALMTTPAIDAQDAKAVLQAASSAMGAATLNSVQYSGAGWNAAVGQSFGPAEDWPRFDVTAYTRVIDYASSSSREELTRRQGNNPPRGGGGTPLQGDQQQRFMVSGQYAWNVQGENAAPAQAAAEVRGLDIWLSPHGFLKAAMAASDVTAVPLMLEGRRVTIVSFTRGRFRINGTITDQNLVERVQTWVANPVFGDMVYEHRYTDYKEFGDVRFPTVLHSHQGDPRLNPGHNWMEIRVTAVQPNVANAALAVPANVRTAAAAPVRAESEQLANGVWRIAGGSHHSVAVEFRDFVTVVEAPQDEARSVAVIAEVRRLVPNKPIRYIVNTHHHFDHSGGLRTYVAESATVITHQQNREFYEDVLLHPAPRTLEPDRLSKLYPWFAGNRVPAIEAVNQKYVVSDGVRVLDLYPVQGLNHANNMLIAYLPAERILINADLYGPPAAGAQPPAMPNANMLTLRQNIQRLNLDVARHVGIHGAVGSHADFMSVVNRAPSTN